MFIIYLLIYFRQKKRRGGVNKGPSYSLCFIFTIFITNFVFAILLYYTAKVNRVAPAKTQNNGVKKAK